MFVCLGNICRSPAAHGLFEDYLKRIGENNIKVESSGTGDWHVGESADPRMRKHAKLRGHELRSKALHFRPEFLNKYDLVIAMDRSNLTNIEKIAPVKYSAKLTLFSEYKNQFDYDEVPDPYFGGDEGFEHVLDLIEDALDNLYEDLKNA